MRLTPDLEDQRFIRRLAYILLAVGLAVFLWRTAHLLLLAFGALLVSVLFDTVADWIAARTPLRHTWGLAIAVLLFLAVLTAIGWLFGAETGSQVQRLQLELPHDIARLEKGLATHPAGAFLLDSIRTATAGERAATVAAGLSVGAGEILVNFIIVIIGGVFFAASPRVYRHGLVRLAPDRYRAVVDRALLDVGRALKLWLRTQILSMLIMGSLIALGLWLSGIEVWGALGVLGGLSEFIPYVGPTLAMIPAIIVGLVGPGSIWGVLATYAVVRLIQANIITPLISQRVVHVPPGLYLFGIIAMGFAFGTFGLFFSGALVVAAYTLIRRLYLAETLGDEIPHPGDE